MTNEEMKKIGTLLFILYTGFDCLSLGENAETIYNNENYNNTMSATGKIIKTIILLVGACLLCKSCKKDRAIIDNREVSPNGNRGMQFAQLIDDPVLHQLNAPVPLNEQKNDDVKEEKKEKKEEKKQDIRIVQLREGEEAKEYYPEEGFRDRNEYKEVKDSPEQKEIVQYSANIRGEEVRIRVVPIAPTASATPSPNVSPLFFENARLGIVPVQSIGNNTDDQPGCYIPSA